MFATTRRPKPGPTDVYRLYDRRGNLLYIGITNSTYHRFAQHAADKHWWSQVDLTRTETVRYPTRNQALRVEEYAIKTELPTYNKVHHPAWGGTYVGERPASRVSSPFIAAAVCLGLLGGAWVGWWWIPVGPQIALGFFALLAVRLGWLRR